MRLEGCAAPAARTLSQMSAQTTIQTDNRIKDDVTTEPRRDNASSISTGEC
jgi:hypothetical protein